MIARNSIVTLLAIAALTIFLSGCAGRCAPRPEAKDDDPRVTEESFSFTELPRKFMNIFCTKEF
jgi:PBP1b-binding outer membrane lipoprotein LpoB